MFFCVKHFGVMANFDMYDDDNFEGLFLTQQGRSDKMVSLEEEGEFRTVLSPNYSDISEDETEERGKRLRCVFIRKYIE